MKFAYLIVAHKNAPQVLRLYARLRHPGAVFVFHFDRGCQPAFYQQVMAALQDQPDCLFAERVRVVWGGWGMTQAALNCLQALQESGLSYDRVFLLSGQDYPLKTHAEMVEKLAIDAEKNYIEYRSYAEMTQDERDRYDRVHFRPFHWLHFGFPPRRKHPLAWLVNGLVIAGLPNKTERPVGIAVYKGATWWGLEKFAVDYILQQAATPKGRRLLDYFRYVNLPDEGYFQTVLLNSPFRATLVNESLHFICWQAGHYHPAPFSPADFKEMIASGKLFARKFELPADAALLDRIDEHLDRTEDPHGG